MNLNDVKQKLLELGSVTFDYEKFLNEVINLKKQVVSVGNEDEGKQLWVIEQIIEIHLEFNNVFKLLKRKQYNDAWCKLERIEITFHSLKRHFSFNKTEYKLYFIEKSVRNLQVIFPYKLFSSMEILEKEKKCSICDEILKFRSPCGHKIGEIYGGEICCRVITKFDLLGIALVENPVNKYSVLFDKDGDQYNYDVIITLINSLPNAYHPWELIIQNKYHPHINFNNIKNEDACPCGSGIDYIECCKKEKGVKHLHYRFIVKDQKSRKQTNISK
ncbi:zinc chelation protein SecC [Chryseobacterium salivictor]|uniref:SEC-C motif-containing protein n=1 Tax=Chryseobacterium salivictor TaxID=2547600 RepID=A0A4P6ZIY9_9FLAO|nr:zinc chelation protein SecC [Chryseobacterium salivictor]QBO59618.1 hypothetical protein NBC122_02817 [Chryseobacterium salivictor]